MIYSAPTYNIDTEEWSYTDFETKKEVRDFLDSHFKYPGQYNIKHSQGLWNEMGVHWTTHGSYPKYVKNSTDYRKFWEFEKEKSKLDGFIIYKSERDDTEHVVPGLFYWYLNYCPIPNKLEGKPTIGYLWDSDLHYYLYILRCQWHGKFGALVKKRQWGSSLKNMSIIANSLWFGESWTSKVFALDQSQVEDSWIFLEAYADHINKYTAFKRGFEPRKNLHWVQRVKLKDGSGFHGLNNIAKGITTSASPTKGVGGDAKVIFGEEAGTNSKLDKTHNYLKSNVAIGGVVTGLIIYAGAVGELEHADPLKEFITNPIPNGILPCAPMIPEDIEEFGDKPTGLFAPEWWNYIAEDDDGNRIFCYDMHGNSNKEMSLEWIMKERKKTEDLKPQDLLMEVSQHPLSLKEAFAYRKESLFPQDLLLRQLHRIERGDYPYKSYDLERTENGIEFVPNKHPAITDYPFKSQKGIIPYGAVQVWEEPLINESTGFPEWGMYFAGVDPIAVDVTSTSDSLFCVIIYKNATEVSYIEDGEQKTRIEGDKIVAKYIGRQSDRKKTNALGMMLIEKYNAFAVVENNIDNFITDAIYNQKGQYLATKDDLPFNKELTRRGLVSTKEYGVRTNKGMWDTQYIPKPIEYMKEEIGTETFTDGKPLRTVFGVEKIPDRQLVKEYLAFTNEKGNYDAIVTFGLVLALAKARQANHLISKRDEIDPNAESRKKRITKVPRNSSFKSRHKSRHGGYRKSAFKNVR